jgi:hypothetical protein
LLLTLLSHLISTGKDATRHDDAGAAVLLGISLDLAGKRALREVGAHFIADAKRAKVSALLQVFL